MVAESATVTGVDADLQEVLPRITGTVTHAARTAGARRCHGIPAERYAVEDEEGFDHTNALGEFSVAVRAGTYRIGFESYDFAPDDYSDEFWNDVSFLSSAQDIEVSADSVITGIDADLEVAAPVTGTVTGEFFGEPLDEVRVEAYGQDPGTDDWVVVSEDVTDVDGDFVIKSLAAGIYRVRFSDPSLDHLPEFWDGAVDDVDLADDIVLAEAATQDGIDAALTLRTPPLVTNLTLPTIAGTAQVGQVLAATSGTWKPDDATLAYQWLRVFEQIPEPPERPTRPRRLTSARRSGCRSLPPSPATHRTRRGQSRRSRDSRSRAASAASASAAASSASPADELEASRALRCGEGRSTTERDDGRVDPGGRAGGRDLPVVRGREADPRGDRLLVPAAARSAGKTADRRGDGHRDRVRVGCRHDKAFDEGQAQGQAAVARRGTGFRLS